MVTVKMKFEVERRGQRKYYKKKPFISELSMEVKKRNAVLHAGINY